MRNLDGCIREKLAKSGVDAVAIACRVRWETGQDLKVVAVRVRGLLKNLNMARVCLFKST